jgi:thioredoxin-dependent peroxiredoxin
MMHLAAAIAVLLLTPLVAAAMPSVGDKAPDFTLTDQHGKAVHLSAFRGKSTVVVAFYPMAFTPG